MFQEWSFLIGEIWGLLIMAALLGLLTGWVIWGYGAQEVIETETKRLRADLDASWVAQNEKTAQIKALRTELSEQKPFDDVAEAPDGKPVFLSEPRNGKADSLTKIKGIGPKLEHLLNNMGIYHYDQIAGWNDAEIAWMDENLKGFKGRVSRDNWIDQAKSLRS
ncbi:hypothetical protein [Parasulfitobacter algicola]|uniref:Uncharacterized protein n=1 Tax=Parasulfitobacter algicola TaxID=2614809 RepID=A0ABX2IKM8_9RHOB|nr:hypothetical protein [Sulfitobacter algicola]NSX53412.1 hypothetical protein [Sulfitobacter algicola]